MRHLRAVNQKADRIEKIVADSRSTSEDVGGDVVALQDGPHIPLGCSFVFDPGWEADVNGGTAGLCQPVERDLFDCYITCYWLAGVVHVAVSVVLKTRAAGDGGVVLA